MQRWGSFLARRALVVLLLGIVLDLEDGSYVSRLFRGVAKYR